MKNILIFFKTKNNTMKKMSLVCVVFCTCILLSFTSCSRGYGCPYGATETIPEQSEISTTEIAVASKTLLSDELNCLP